MARYWSTPHGLRISHRHRRLDSLFVTAELVPPSKRSIAAAKMRAREKLHAAFAGSDRIAELYPRLRWPKPRAAIALDISLHGDVTRAPRVDTICKWLLDELTGLVYRDDRQVKFLFARADREDLGAGAATTRREQQEAGPAKEAMYPIGDPWGLPMRETTSRASASAKAKASTTLHVHARTRANVLATLRIESDLPYEWDFDDEDDDFKYWNPYVRSSSGGRRSLVEYHGWLRADTNMDPAEFARAERELDYHDQAAQQRVVDVVFSSLFTFLVTQKFLGWTLFRERLTTAPYIFDLGVLPAVGESGEFKARLRRLLEHRREEYPELFPMRAKSGISMVLFEDGEHGKDLDNLIRTVLPDVLDVLRPPRTDLPGWVAAAPDVEAALPDIPFLEVAAISAADAGMRAGTVLFGLSGGHRYESWWAKAESAVERRLDRILDWD